jgi:hypothetical protein
VLAGITCQYRPDHTVTDEQSDRSDDSVGGLAYRVDFTTKLGRIHMGYQVRFCSDDSLPEVEWVFVRTSDETYLIVRQSAINTTTGQCDALSRAWEAWQRLEVEAHTMGLNGFSAAARMSHDERHPVGA